MTRERVAWRGFEAIRIRLRPGNAGTHEGDDMDFADSPEQAAFRKEVEAFFDANFPEELVADPNVDPRTEGRRRGEDGGAMKKWRAALVEKGWIAPAWPKEYGGADLSPMEQFILNETVAKRGAPMVRVPDVGSTIMVHGSEEQK
ncbi:MAG: acyl-CoA dehydrogenase family protein, partial [Dehalococcoidia bacterium]|nr:acyl-CoA dehydrogenase family protein [Dehalococcoidia bacterium]